MMAEMSGLFGPAPNEIEQQRMAAMQQAANTYAQQTPIERAAAGMYQAGGMLGGMGAKAMGGVDPQEDKAKKIQMVISKNDINTVEGRLSAARQLNSMGLYREAQFASEKAQELKKQEDAAALATRKEDRAEKKLEEVDKQRMENDFELKKQQLTQAFEIAKMRSEDSRLNSADRLAASREATAARVQMAQLMAEMKRIGIESKAGAGIGGKPLTAAQQAKLLKDQAASSAAIRSQDSEIESLGGDIAKVMANPNLGRATGVRGMIPSMPGGQASQIEGQLASIQNRMKAQGLKVLREGGGIGAITEKEWDILANQVANIDRSKGADYVKGELEKVDLRMKDLRRNAMQRHYEQFGEEYSPGRDIPTSPSIQPNTRKTKSGVTYTVEP